MSQWYWRQLGRWMPITVKEAVWYIERGDIVRLGDPID